jgi:ADP-ribose pyrophosphatase YjhB (NUDIX family)
VTQSVLKLTGFKFCPHCGKKSLEAASDKAIHCTECDFHYYHNAAAAVAAIIEAPRGIVFLRRARDPGKGLLDLPGGFVDYHESAEVALRRELREELGVELGALAHVASFPNIYTYRSVTYHTTDLFYRCRYETPEQFVLSDESTELVFVKAGRIDLDTIAFESSRNVLNLIGVLTSSPPHAPRRARP